jgi:hypothetical protein
MTESEAIMIIENERPSCGEKIKFTEEEKYEAYSMAIQALEKQMPKKPDFTEDKEFVLCPCCNGKGLLNKQKYCDNCGQKLDWSEESEG